MRFAIIEGLMITDKVEWRVVDRKFERVVMMNVGRWICGICAFADEYLFGGFMLFSSLAVPGNCFSLRRGRSWIDVL